MLTFLINGETHYRICGMWTPTRIGIVEDWVNHIYRTMGPSQSVWNRSKMMAARIFLNKNTEPNHKDQTRVLRRKAPTIRTLLPHFYIYLLRRNDLCVNSLFSSSESFECSIVYIHRVYITRGVEETFARFDPATFYSELLFLYISSAVAALEVHGDSVPLTTIK
jgi:hypothetical protein